MINYNSQTTYDCHGIPAGCADFTIKRHDTRPTFNVDITDCDNPIDLSDLVIESSMWVTTKLKTTINTSATTISFADNIGFEQINLDTIIQVGSGRAFERISITAINEEAKTITVIRGQLDTISYNWKKGTVVKLLRFLNNPSIGELEYKDVENLDGNISEDQLVKSTLIYEWSAEDTCLAGKYFLEFKVMKISSESNIPVPSNIPNYHCYLGQHVLWARRFPVDREGFLIEVFDSPTAE